MEIKFLKEGVSQKLTFYNIREYKLGDYKDADGNPWQLYFVLSREHCGGVVLPNSTPKIKEALKSIVDVDGIKITNLPAFCCCQDESWGGRTCKRWVTRDLSTSNFAPSCEQGYRPYDYPKGASCKSLEKQGLDKTVPAIDLGAAVNELNQLPDISSPAEIIGLVIRVLVAFVGSITLALYVWAGLLWMTAGGKSDQIEKAKSILLWTTFGLAIMLGSYVVVDYFLNLF
jgi:hypothetical protein